MNSYYQFAIFTIHDVHSKTFPFLFKVLQVFCFLQVCFGKRQSLNQKYENEPILKIDFSLHFWWQLLKMDFSYSLDWAFYLASWCKSRPNQVKFNEVQWFKVGLWVEIFLFKWDWFSTWKVNFEGKVLAKWQQLLTVFHWKAEVSMIISPEK